MPIYPYICERCNYEFDRLQKISDDPLKVCPECGTEALRKKLTAAAFHLKGTGWYETDFKDKKDKGKGDQKGDGKDAKKTGDGDKSDAKSGDSKTSGASSASGSGKSGGDGKSVSSDTA